MVFDTVIFYNHFGNGDLFNSREFIKELIQKGLGKRYIYAHAKSKAMFQDIPEIERMFPVPSHCQTHSHYKVLDNDTLGLTLYLNTWIGVESKYVLPGIGCTIEKNLERYNAILKELELSFRLDQNTIEYLPKIDYGKLDQEKLENIDKFMLNYPTVDNIVLISNGDVQSNQAQNFDFTPIIQRLVNTYPDNLFITTQDTGIIASNLTTTADIINTYNLFDLNYISYLSTYCDVIIGRASGPYCFTQIYENMLDPFKTFLTFSYTPEGAYFLLDRSGIGANTSWSSETSTEGVFNEICKIL